MDANEANAFIRLNKENEELKRSLTEAQKILSDLKNTDRLVKTVTEQHYQIQRLKQRFASAAGHIETALKMSLDSSTDDLSTIPLPSHITALIASKYQN